MAVPDLSMTKGALAHSSVVLFNSAFVCIHNFHFVSEIAQRAKITRQLSFSLVSISNRLISFSGLAPSRI